MTAHHAPLLAACVQLRESTRSGLDWLIDNEKGLAQDLAAPIRELRKALVEARRLERAAGRKMCVGVFGPSQAGKSYLISALARHGTQPLLSDFGGQFVDFLAAINPQGDKESTGLVTRFTIDRPEGLPPGFPVQVRLLSETDIVKVLANAYVFDVDRDQEDEAVHNRDDIQQRLAELEARVRPRSVGVLDEVDIVDLEDYCNRRLIKSPRFKVLRKTDYWRTATRIAPRLTPQDRAVLFGVLWEDIGAFTNIYRRLYQVLERFGFPDTLYAEYAALADRAHSIITVDTLAGIGEGKGDEVQVMAPNGSQGGVVRSELAAMTAELKIVMRDLPFDFFRDTDLLDFPGYRSRMKIDKLPEYIQQNGMRELMIRGKVAYLFERYSDERELTSMLLCQGPENFEVMDLIPVVYDWIRTSHGAQPAERLDERTALFFVMTKFDMVFQQSAGKAEDATRFLARLDNNLLQSYGKQAYENGDKAWPLEWTPGTAFQNIFLLRNPAIVQDNLFDYEATPEGRREVGVREDKQAYLDRLRRAFIDAPVLRRHFPGPEASWDAMMTLNDGGVCRIAERLRPVCDPRTKSLQVTSRAKRLAEEVSQRLRPYFFSGDIAEQKKKKRAVVTHLSERLKKCFDREQFGTLLSVMQLSADALYELYEVVERRPARMQEAALAAPAQPSDADEGHLSGDDSFLLDLLRGPDADAHSPASGPGSASVSVLDLPSQYARAVEAAWEEHLLGLIDDAPLLRYFELTRRDMVMLTQELLTGARRFGLIDHLGAAISRGASFRQISKTALIWKQAKPAAAVVNDFVAFLGFGGALRPGGSSLEVEGRVFKVFEPRPPVTGEPVLGPQALRYDSVYFRAWMIAFIRLAEDNVTFEAGTKINITENERLGDVLSRLAVAFPAP